MLKGKIIIILYYKFYYYWYLVIMQNKSHLSILNSFLNKKVYKVMCKKLQKSSKSLVIGKYEYDMKYSPVNRTWVLIVYADSI